jgi:hypothetical protein
MTSTHQDVLSTGVIQIPHLLEPSGTRDLKACGKRESKA